MIISRTPLRITLAGGGTDIPDFYKKFGGSVTSLAINKYIYVNFKENILDDIVRLRYLKTEEVENANKLSNERARVVLQHFKIFNKCEITSIGDLPSSSGLGSSGSYLVGLINSIQKFKNNNFSKQEIANLACHLEMNELNEPVGKQDQFIASYGGIKTFNIDKNGLVSVQEVLIDKNNLNKFIENNRIYYTGILRSASSVLKNQKNNQSNYEERMKKIQDLSVLFLKYLQEKKFDDYGNLLDEHWRQKKGLSTDISIDNVDNIYSTLIKQKLILGGKIIGAGGGGFLLVYSHKDHAAVDNYMNKNGLIRLNYSDDQEGSKIIYE